MNNYLLNLIIVWSLLHPPYASADTLVVANPEPPILLVTHCQIHQHKHHPVAWIRKKCVFLAPILEVAVFAADITAKTGGL